VISTRPSSPFDELDLDPGIRPLLKAMNSGWLITLGSCQGHLDKPSEGTDASVEFAVRNDRIPTIVKLLQRAEEKLVKAGIGVELSIIVSPEVVTACDYDQYPNWTMFEMIIFQLRLDKPPTKTQLAALTSRFRSIQ
jgi:hypothetical protein